MKSYKKLSLALLTLAAFSYANSTQTNEAPEQYRSHIEIPSIKTWHEVPEQYRSHAEAPRIKTWNERRQQDHALLIQYLRALGRNVTAICDALHVRAEQLPELPEEIMLQ